MTLGRYVGCVIWLLLAVAPPMLAAYRIRARYFPTWLGATARLAEITLAVGGVVIVCEVLGVLGAFRRWPVALALASAGLAAAALARPSGERTIRSPSEPRARRARGLEMFACALSVAVVIALWSVPVLAVWGSGPTDSDTQTYHLPHAAQFVQDGSLADLHYPTVDDAVPYHPSSSELFHAMGMLAFGTDVLTLIINVGWLLLALLAVWVVGETWGVGPLSVIGASAAFATPIMATTQAGSAMNDIAAIALLLAACAFLVRAPADPALIALAGLAAGLALGIKLTTVVPAAVLTIAVVVAARRSGHHPLKAGWLWTLPLLIGGSFWYLRNLIAVGNPVPSMHLGIGPVGFQKVPMLLIDRYGYSVADYALDLDVWRGYFIPGLARGLTAAWPLMILLAAGALLFVLLSPVDPFTKAVAAAGAVSAIAYLFTPTTALGLKGQPSLFTGNLRYVVPALVIGLMLAPATSFVRAHRHRRWLFVATCAVVLIAALRVDWRGNERPALVAAGAVLSALTVGVLLARRRMLLVSVVSGTVALCCFAGFFVSREYVENRYAYPDPAVGRQRDPAAYRWAQGVSRAKIGTTGFFLNYPLYGSDLSNDVSYIGTFRANHEFTNLRTCEAWRSAVNSGDYDYVVTMPPFAEYPPPEAAAWARSDDAVDEIVRSGGASVFRVVSRLDPTECPAKASERTPRNDGSRRVDPGTEP